MMIQDQGEAGYVVLDDNGNFYARTYSSVDARLIAAAPRMLERIRRDVEQCGCNSLPVRPLKMPDGSIQVGCGYCREKRAILRDVEGKR